MSERLLFVAHENHKVSKGTTCNWMALYQCWPPNARITVLLNRTHWADTDVRADLRCHANVRCVQLPFRLPSEWIGGRAPVPGRTIVVKALRFGLRALLTAVLAPLTMFWLAAWLKREKCDGILSMNGGWPGGELNRWVIYAGFVAGVRTRVLVLQNMPMRRMWIARLWAWLSERVMGRLATELVAVSRSCKASLEQGTAFHRDLKMIYNGIPISGASAPGAAAEAPWPRDRPVVGFVGELAPRKGVHVLVEAMQFVREPCQLVLIGTCGPGRGGAEYVRRLEVLADRSPWDVRFLGFRENVPELYPHLDVLVLPSIQFECLGMVLVEAMLYEKPAICSDFSGMKEVVAHGETGLVVQAGNAAATASALNTLLSDAALRQRMGKAGRKRVEECFSATTMTERYVALFDNTSAC